MPLPFGLANSSTLPMNVLFPEAYRASAKQTVKDFAFFGVSIVGGVVLLVTFFG